jgi:hypothetical protein
MYTFVLQTKTAAKWLPKKNHTKADYYSSPFGRYTAWLAMFVSNPNQLLYGYHIKTLCAGATTKSGFATLITWSVLI